MTITIRKGDNKTYIKRKVTLLKEYPYFYLFKVHGRIGDYTTCMLKVDKGRMWKVKE